MPSLTHHPKFMESYKLKLDAWQEAQCRDTVNKRCGKCWLRVYQCYCKTLNERAKAYSCPGLQVANTEVINYYSFKEVGRSPNTAHIMERILPHNSSSLIYGDMEAEDKLIEEMVEEYVNFRVRTCILYPTTDAKIVSDWRIEVEEYNTSGKDKDKDKGEGEEEVETRYRLIALDGTYPEARRMFTYLSAKLEAKGVPKCAVPVVKLDLGEEGFIKSAYLGLMHQPGREKICTFQAVALAFGELGESKEVCDALREDLDAWIHYLLRTKIKSGKEEIKIPSDLMIFSGAASGKSLRKKKEKSGVKEATRAVFRPPEIVTAYHRKWVDESGAIRKGKGEEEGEKKEGGLAR